MLPSTPLEVRDAVWRYLIERVRGEGGDWQIYALVAQRIALKGIAVHLAPKYVSREEIRQANVEVTACFLVTCGRMQIRTPHVGARLVDQTKYHAENAYWTGRNERTSTTRKKPRSTACSETCRCGNGIRAGTPTSY